MHSHVMWDPAAAARSPPRQGGSHTAWTSSDGKSQGLGAQHHAADLTKCTSRQ